MDPSNTPATKDDGSFLAAALLQFEALSADAQVIADSQLAEKLHLQCAFQCGHPADTNDLVRLCSACRKMADE